MGRRRRHVVRFAVAALVLAASALGASGASAATEGGRWLYFLSGSGFDRAVWRAQLDGRDVDPGTATCLTPTRDQVDAGENGREYDVSADGRFIVQAVAGYPTARWPARRPGLMLHDLALGTQRRLTSAPDTQPRFSPDGERVAFVRHPRRNVFGLGRLYVTKAAGGSARWVGRQVEVRQPTWRPDGRSIAYLKGRFVYQADVRSGQGRWLVGRPGPVGTLPYAPVVEGLEWTRRGLLYTSSFIPDPSAGGTMRGEPDVGIYITRGPVAIKGRLVRSLGSRRSVRTIPGSLSLLPDGTILGQLRRGVYAFRPGRKARRLSLPRRFQPDDPIVAGISQPSSAPGCADL